MKKHNDALVIVELGKKAALQEMPYPVIGDEDIIIRTHYSGVSIGTEMWIASGKRKDYGPVPFINGYQATGEVCEIGKRVEEFSVGDLVVVFCSGAHSRYVKTKQSLAHKLQNKASTITAALFVQPSTAANALNLANVKTGDVVYVVGQGMIGQATAALAKLRGAYVIASDLSPLRLDISKKHCADWVIDASDTKTVSKAIKTRYPDGVDVVIESTGFANLLDDAFLCCKEHGSFVFEGWYPGNIDFYFNVPHEKQVAAFFPCFIGDRPVREGVIRLIESNKLDIKPLISNVVHWKDAVDIYNTLFTEKRNKYNGIVIDWTEES